MLGTILDVTFPSPTIIKSQSSTDQPSSRFEMVEMENVSWSRRDLHCQEEEKRNFLPRLSTLLTVQGEDFSCAAHPPRWEKEDWIGEGMEYGGRNWGSLAPFSAAEFIG